MTLIDEWWVGDKAEGHDILQLGANKQIKIYTPTNTHTFCSAFREARIVFVFWEPEVSNINPATTITSQLFATTS